MSANESSMLVLGAGPMAAEYVKVLRALALTPIVVGRGARSAAKFTEDTGVAVTAGGLDAYVDRHPGALPARAIVATGEKWIGSEAMALMRHGVRRLLVEKPGGIDVDDIRAVDRSARQCGARVYVGYNRRFYASVEAARRIIQEDGGVTSFHFEFTEWGHVISALEKEEGVKEQWFLANSTHVIDLAFHLGGRPAQMAAFAGGSLPWHPAASVFAGAGLSESGALFSYHANWQAPGRWSLEVLTRKHRLVFRPMERLQVQLIGSVAIEFVEIDDALDKEFKPGLHRQVRAFLADDASLLPTISDQVAMLPWYLAMREGRTGGGS
jgi:predicted dehydrogenase